MAEHINRSDAEKVLLSAFRTRCSKQDIVSANIITILGGSHKTYKYILVNGLLAKATNQLINALALQANAPLTGSFDARTLCHNVLVPFERDFLQNALGGSNEPFLNKPARFTHLSTTNAVRKGRDKATLELLIGIFNSISTSSEASAYLSCALEYLNQRIIETQEINDVTLKYNPTLVEIYEFIFRFLEKSYEGETCVIVVGTFEKIYHRRFSKQFDVVCHKVNQSGSSSKEVGDIDIFKENIFYYAVEVKDKNFTSYDVAHAFQKMQSSGASKGQFIYGPNAAFDLGVVGKKITEFENQGFMILLQDIFTYSRTMIFKIDLNSKQEFIDTVMETANEINCKEDTKNWFQTLLTELSWK